MEEEAEIKWMRNGKEIKATKKDKRIKIDWNMKDDSQFLEIKEATVEDAGTYTVVISNSGGSSQSVAKVTVNRPVVEEPESEEEEEEESEESESSEESEDEIKIPKPQFAQAPTAVTVQVEETIRLTFRLTEG